VSQSHYWKIVVGSAGVLVIAAGAIVVQNYLNSQKHIHHMLNDISVQGKNLNSEQCVDAVMHLISRCEAMKSLCDMTTPRLMETCLSAQTRNEECRVYEPSFGDTGFGFKPCVARGVTRKNKKTCGTSYRVIESYCKQTLGKSEQKGG
jgi:hypothetical protein